MFAIWDIYSMKCVLIETYLKKKKETYKYESLNIHLNNSKLIFLILLWVHAFLMHSYPQGEDTGMKCKVHHIAKEIMSSEKV